MCDAIVIKKKKKNRSDITPDLGGHRPQRPCAQGRTYAKQLRKSEVKGRSHSVEERTCTHSYKITATSQPASLMKYTWERRGGPGGYWLGEGGGRGGGGGGAQGLPATAERFPAGAGGVFVVVRLGQRALRTGLPCLTGLWQ